MCEARPFPDGIGIIKEQKAIAKAMLADNVALNLIAKYTGLPEAQILELKPGA